MTMAFTIPGTKTTPKPKANPKVSFSGRKDEPEYFDEAKIEAAREALMFATNELNDADVLMDEADRAYCPAMVNLEAYREWQVKSDIAKANREVARRAAAHATNAYLDIVGYFDRKKR